MISIDARLRRLQSIVNVKPPDPVLAAVSERICVAMALTKIDIANGRSPEFRRTFFQRLASLKLIVPESLMEFVWRRALSLPATPHYLTRLQVPPAMRGKAIRLRAAAATAQAAPQPA